MGTLDYIILALVICGIVAAVAYIIRHRKNGCAECSGDCSTCGKKK